MSVIIYHLSPSATFDMSCLGAPQIEGLVGFVLEELVPYRGVFACRHYQNEHIIGCGFWWTHNFLKTLPNDGKQNRTKIQVILWESWLKKVQFQIFQPQISCHDCYVHDKIIMKNRPVLPRSPHQHLWPWSRWNNPMENLQNRQASFFQHKTPINKVWHPVFFQFIQSFNHVNLQNPTQNASYQLHHQGFPSVFQHLRFSSTNFLCPQHQLWQVVRLARVLGTTDFWSTDFWDIFYRNS